MKTCYNNPTDSEIVVSDFACASSVPSILMRTPFLGPKKPRKGCTLDSRKYSILQFSCSKFHHKDNFHWILCILDTILQRFITNENLRTALFWVIMQCVVVIPDILGQFIGPIFKGQESFLFGFLITEDGTDRLSQNVGKELPLLAA